MPFSAGKLPTSAKNLEGAALTRFISAANAAINKNPDDEAAAIRIGLAAAKGKGDAQFRIDRIGTVYVDRAEMPAGGIRGHIDSITGFLHVRDSKIARSGTLEYTDGQTVWNEFRSDAAIERAAPSFSNVVFTNTHPPVLVTTENAEQFTAGHVGTVRKQGAFLIADEIVITRADAIARAQEPGGWELSIGFLTDVVKRDGVHDGTSFAFEQTNLEGNHVAGEDVGRAGPECRLGMDSAFSVAALAELDAPEHSHSPAKGGPMTDEEKKAAEAKAKADAKIKADAEAKVKADAAEAAKKAAEAKAKQDPPKEPEVKIDHAKMVRDRVAILDSAKSILGKVDHDADDPTIMLAVIAKVDGEDTMKAIADKSDDFIRASFDAAVRTHERQSRVDTAAQIAAMTGVRGDAQGEKFDLNKEFNSYTTYLRDAHKKPAAHTEPKSR